MLEHVSLTVRDIDAMTRFLCTAFPDFHTRGSGANVNQGWSQNWSHVGNNDQYIALYEAKPNAAPPQPAHTTAPSANHIGAVVDDVESVRSRLISAGYTEGFVPEPHPHRRRVYFVDPEGFEWEFVEYFSTDVEKRNQY